jgi:hypothetical protein
MIGQKPPKDKKFYRIREAQRHKILDFLCTEGTLDAELAQRMLMWRHSGFSVHNGVHTKADDAEGRQRLSHYMIRCPFSLEKIRYAPDSGMVIYRCKPQTARHTETQLPTHACHQMAATPDEPYPDRYEHPVRYYGYYTNRSRGARRLIEIGDNTAGSIHIDEPPANTRRKAAWARLIQKAYEADPLECVNTGSNMRIITLIDDVDVVERILNT